MDIWLIQLGAPKYKLPYAALDMLPENVGAPFMRAPKKS